MKEKLLNLKNKLVSFFMKIGSLVKTNKIVLISIVAIALLLIIAIIVLGSTKKIDNTIGNLKNLGFSASNGKDIFYVGYKQGATDGIYKIQGKNKVKISDDYGYYLNLVGNDIYYIDAIDNNIMKMATNGKDKQIIIENVDVALMTVKNGYIYYFDNSYFYRVKTNGENKQRISNKTLDNYQIIENAIYYSYLEDGNYSIYKMDLDGENNKKIQTECGKEFCVISKSIYYIYEKNESSITTHELYKMSTKGENKNKLADISGLLDLSTINFSRNGIYYAKRDGIRGLGIYKLELNGKSETKIIDVKGYSTKINVNGNSIYYPDTDESGILQVFTINKNGKGNKETL